MPPRPPQQRIFVLSPHYVEYNARLALGLAMHCDVFLFAQTQGADRELTDTLRADLARLDHVAFAPTGRRVIDLLFFAKVVAAVLAFRPTTILAPEMGHWYYTPLLRVLARIAPVGLIVHDPAPHSGADADHAARIAGRLRTERALATTFVVHGQFCEGVLRANTPIGRRPVANILHGPILIPATCQTAPRRHAAQVLLFGRMQAYKGLTYLLAAADRLHHDGYRLELVLAGRGPELDRLADDIARRPFVTVKSGFIMPDEVIALLQSATVLVAPYLDATQSGVIAAGLANRTPIVASHVGSIPDLVIEGGNGLLVPPADVDALYRALKAVIDRPPPMADYRVPAGFAWDAIASQILRLNSGSGLRQAAYQGRGIMTDPTAKFRRVGIFRLELMKRSETFIGNQVGQYRDFAATYIGRSAPDNCAARGDVITLGGGRWAAFRLIVLRDAARLRDKLAGAGLDLIHAHFATDGSVAVPLAAGLGIPLVVTLHGFDVTVSDRQALGSRQPTLVQAVLQRRKLWRRTAAFLCVSEHIRTKAIERGYPPEKLIVHRIGIRIGPEPSWQKTGANILHVCRLVEKKGTRYVIEAMPDIVRACPLARLTIIGDGPLRADLEHLARALGIADHITFMGERDHATVLTVMAASAVVCIPSVTAANGDTEGLPTVVYEAGALGVPVVASQSSGIPEAVDHGVTGLLVAERDTGAIAEGIARILRDDALRLRMGQAARRRMAEDFDIARQTSRLEDIYRSVLDAGAGR